MTEDQTARIEIILNVHVMRSYSRLHANETRSNWTRSIFSVPMRRVSVGRFPMRRVPNRHGCIVMADIFTCFITYCCIIDVFMRNERCAFIFKLEHPVTVFYCSLHFRVSRKLWIENLARRQADLPPFSEERIVSNIENADILLTQCPEKRRKQAYIYAKIWTGSVQNCLLCNRVNISADIRVYLGRVQLEHVSLARWKLTASNWNASHWHDTI